jgi:hypothetical protein
MHDTPKVNETTRQWQGLKQRPTQFGDWKNTPRQEWPANSSDYFKRVKEEEPPVGAHNVAMAGLEKLAAELGPTHPDYVPKDNIDTCLVCDTEVPPGPDFCSSECEERAKNEPKEGQ